MATVPHPVHHLLDQRQLLVQPSVMLVEDVPDQLP